VTFILGNKAGGKQNLSPALYFRTIVQQEAIFFSQERKKLRKNILRPATNEHFLLSLFSGWKALLSWVPDENQKTIMSLI
jgi:hypothetical protein